MVFGLESDPFIEHLWDVLENYIMGSLKPYADFLSDVTKANSMGHPVRLKLTIQS